MFLSWSPSVSGTPPIHYQVQSRQTGDTEWADYGLPTDNTWLELGGLVSGQSYDFRVVASNLAGSSASAPVTFVAPSPAVPPSVPQNLNGASIGPTSITLTWDTSIGDPVIKYQPRYRLNGQSAWIDFGTSIPDLTATITDLVPDHLYDFSVVASNTAGAAVSDIYRATTTGFAPNAPTDVALSQPHSNSLVVSWTDSTTGSIPITYTIQYRIVNTPNWIDFPGAVVSPATITGLVPSTNYEVRVKATNTNGSAFSLSATATTAGVAPNAPANLTAVIADQVIALSWAPSSVGSIPILYQARYRQTGNTAWIDFGTASQQTTQVLTGLTPGTSYDFMVVASNSVGIASSAIAVFVTTVTAAPATWNPSDKSGITLSGGNLTATSSANTAVGVRSDASHNANRFYVEFAATTANPIESVGFANAAWSLTNAKGVGADLNSFGLRSDGTVRLNDILTGVSKRAWVAGDVVGMAVDFTADRAYFRYNNESWGAGVDPVAGTGGYIFSSMAAGPYFVAFGALPTGHVTGHQSSGTSDPIVAGPASFTVVPGASLTLTGITFTDSIEPHAGTVAMNVGCSSGTLRLSSGNVTGNGTNVLTVNDTYEVCQAAIASLVYTAPGSTGSDSVTVELFDQFGQNNSIAIAGTIAASDPVAKTVNLGGSAFAFAAPSGYQAWGTPGGIFVGVAPNAPTNIAASAPTSSSASINWTNSTTGTDPISYKVQYRLHGALSWTDFATVSPAGPVVVGGLSPSSQYDFQVVASNQYGAATSSAFATITTLATSGDLTGVTAFRIADLLEGFGWNVYAIPSFPSNNPSGAAPSNNYSPPAVIAGDRWLTADLAGNPGGSGLTLTHRLWTLHAYLGLTDINGWAAQVAKATGCKFSANPNSSGPGVTSYEIQMATDSHNGTNGWTGLAQGSLKFLEAQNEPNNFGVAASDVAAAQQLIWDACHGFTEIKIMSGSAIFGLPIPDGYISGYYGSNLSTIRGTCDNWNVHIYPYTNPDVNDLNGNPNYPDRTSIFSDVKIGINTGYGAVREQGITEWHPTMYDNTASFGVKTCNQNWDSYYAPMFLLSAFRQGYRLYQWWAMLDFRGQATFSPSEPFYGSGFWQDDPLVDPPRMTAWVIRAMFQLTGDKNPTKHTFTPTKLNYSISNLPVVTGNPMMGGQHMLFQNSDGTFFLFVWNSQIDPRGAATNVPISFPNGVANVKDYNITNISSTSAPTTALQDRSNTNSITVALDASVHLLVITAGGVAPPALVAPGQVLNVQGSATSSSVTVSWQAPSTGGAPSGYQLQYKPSAQATWIDFPSMTTGLAQTVLGLASQTSYDFRVYAANSAGPGPTSTVMTISTSAISTGTGGDTTGPTAFRIADMLETFGANCFNNGQDGAGGNASASAHITGMNIVCGGSGMGWLNRLYSGDASAQSAFASQISAGVPGTKWMICINNANDGGGSVASVVASANNSRNGSGWMKYAEGTNEFNNSSSFGYGPTSQATCLAAQQSMYNQVHSFMEVISPSPIQNSSSTWVQDAYGSTLSGQIAACDYANGHCYPNNGSGNFPFWSFASQLRAASFDVATVFGKPGAFVTEYHPYLFNNVVGEAFGAWQTLCALLSGYTMHNNLGLTWWSFYDYNGFFPVPGLFRGHDPNNPSQSALAMRAAFQLTTDLGATKRTFTPKKLNYTVTGLPSGFNQYAGGHHALFQNSAGRFFIFLWNDQNGLNLGSSSPVTVNFAAPRTRISDYSLTNPAVMNPTAKQVLTNRASVSLNLTTEARLLVVDY